MSKRIPDNTLVRVEVYRDDQSSPIYKGFVRLDKSKPLSLSLNLQVFVTEEAEYGNLASYHIRIKPYRGK